MDRTIITFPGHEAVSHEINAKYLFLRQMSDLGPISAVKHANSRHTLPIECWFLDNSLPMNYADRMSTTFPGHEGVSHEILAKYLIFDDISDLTISPAHRNGFCERMCPSLQVGVYRGDTTLPWDHRRLIMCEIAGRYGVWCHCKGHNGRLGGQFVWVAVWDLIPSLADSGPGKGIFLFEIIASLLKPYFVDP